MVSGSRIEGGPQIVSAGVRKTIQSIKEIVGNHSDSDIFVTLKESNMDANETAQKLLNQDPFHEVKRKREKKKEGAGYKGFTAAEPRKYTEHVGQGAKFNSYSDRNFRRGDYGQKAVPGVSKEFRVVRDNRTNQNVNREVKPPVQNSMSTDEPVIANISEKSLGTSINEKPSVGHHSSQSLDGPSNSYLRQTRDANLKSTAGNAFLEERRPSVSNAASRMHAMKSNDSQPQPTMLSNNYVVGVYSSSSDPVHVPSPDSRPAAIIGAIKREVGVVGVRRQSSQNSVKPSSSQSNSIQNSHLGRDGAASGQSFRSISSISKSDKPGQTNVPESAIADMPVSKSFTSNQYSSRPHQQLVVHQKASQPNKEWKPKSNQKPITISPDVIAMPAKSASPPADDSKEAKTEAAHLQDKLSRINLTENQNVIIAAHIRVSETDRCRLTFGSFGTEFESSRNLGYQEVGGTEDSCAEPSVSLSGSASEPSSEETSFSKPVDLLDDYVRNSESSSPLSGAVSEHHLADKKESSSPLDMDTYADIGLVRDNSPSYTPSESQHQQDPPEVPSFSAYDPQTGYDVPYFRPTVDDTFRGQGLPFPQEALGFQTENSIPASTTPMVQQQPPMAQMYPHVHVSHFANLMQPVLPRQFFSPVYVPPVAMPGGYSNNPAYAHPSNGGSYLLIPGGSSHLSATGVKYGIQQFKPVPTANPTGFGNFTNPTGYAINAPGVVGSATGLEDSSRLKYKDGNLYVPNPQAETSEIWMNPRDIPSMQSAPYYNMQGQTPHAAYLPSHTGHASFNAAAAQSSHMQFPGLYHPPPQPGAIGNPHHLGPAMGGGNVGVGMAAAAPGAQVGAYQQPQLGHMNWTGNF